MKRIQFFVPGRPVPQGSVKAMIVKKAGRSVPVILNTAGNPPLAEWRMKVTSWAAKAAIEAVEEQDMVGFFEGPLGIKIDFILSRPADHFLPANSKRDLPELRPTAPPYPHGKPDLDKLIRAVLDGMTDGHIWDDDAQVVFVTARKSWADDVSPHEGANIIVGGMKE